MVDLNGIHHYLMCRACSGTWTGMAMVEMARERHNNSLPWACPRCRANRIEPEGLSRAQFRKWCEMIGADTTAPPPSEAAEIAEAGMDSLGNHVQYWTTDDMKGMLTTSDGEQLSTGDTLTGTVHEAAADEFIAPYESETGTESDGGEGEGEVELEASGGESDEDDADADADLPDVRRSDMEDRLWRTAERTRLDGSAEAEVLEWMPDDYGGDRPTIRFEDPVRENHTASYRFDMPDTESDEYDFVRFLDEYNLSLRNPGEIVGYEIRVEHSGGEDGEWSPVIPEEPEPPKPPVTDRGRQALTDASIGFVLGLSKAFHLEESPDFYLFAAAFMACWPLTAPYWFFEEHGNPMTKTHPIFLAGAVMVLGILEWVAIVGILTALTILL